MRSKSEAKLQRIKRASNIFGVICKAFLVLVTVAGVGLVAMLTFRIGGINYGGVALQSSQLPIGHRLLLIAMTVLKFSVLFTCFYFLHQLFGSYSRGHIFARTSVARLRQFAVACLVWGVVSFIWDSLWFGVLVNPPRSFPGHFDAFGIGIVLIVIAWFMDMAVELQEENELTI